MSATPATKIGEFRTSGRRLPRRRRWVPWPVGLVVLIGWMVSSVARAEPRITARLGAPTIASDEETTYTLTISDQLGGELLLPRFGDLIVDGPQRSSQTSVQIINGRPLVQASTSYTWSVHAPRTGTFVIGPATLQHQGQNYLSNSLELRVEDTAPGGPDDAPDDDRAARQGRRGQADDDAIDPNDPFALFRQFDPFGMLGNGGDPQARPSAPRGDDLFLRAVVDRTDPYVGQPVMLSVVLFSRIDLAGVQTVSFPKLDAFWSEDLENPTGLTGRQTVIDGVVYNSYVIRRRVLFPLRAGALPIEPVETQVQLSINPFAGGTGELVKRRTPALTLQVKPLPTAGRPGGFPESHVGTVRATAMAQPTRSPPGQPIEVRLTLDIQGNVRQFKTPTPRWPPGFKSFDPTVTDKTELSQGRWRGVRTIDWVLVPSQTGTHTLPPIEVPYFDPEQGTYQVARTEPLTLQIVATGATAGGTGQPSTATPSTDAGGGIGAAPNVIGPGVRPPRLQPDLTPATLVPPWRRAWFWPATAVPVGMLLMVWLWAGLRGWSGRRDPRMQASRQAARRAQEQLSAARLKVDDRDSFAPALAAALSGFVSDRFGIQTRGLTRDQLGPVLREAGVPPPAAEAFALLLQECETARFSPESADPAVRRQQLDDATRLLTALADVHPSAGGAA